MRSGRDRKKAGTVDEYIAAAPKEMRRTLKVLRRAIKDGAPKAEETISYQMPAYKHKGFLVFFGAFKQHMSLFAPGSALKEFRRQLRPYEVSGATIHFTVENPLPSSLVKKIVRARVKENELRARRKK